jgi:dCTP deaminase
VFLGSERILAAVREGELEIEPFDDAVLRPASYVLHLGSRFRSWRAGHRPVRMWSADAADGLLDDPEQAAELALPPGGFVLAVSHENVSLSLNVAALVSPLSHVARFGLAVNLGSDWVNPGFGRRQAMPIVFEVANLSPNTLVLSAGMPICHLRIVEVDGSRSVPPSIYEGGDPLGSPRLWEDFRREEHGGDPR